MNLPMAVRVQQDQIRQRIASPLHSPLQMVEVPVAFVLKLLAADDTLAFLLQPKFQPAPVPACSLHHLTLSAFFKVEFPFGIIRVSRSFDLDVPSDDCLVRLAQPSRTNFARLIQDRTAEHLTTLRLGGSISA